ncbi:MAG: T9SS type A sorting domain-containing protein [Flavobacteriales bacterium]|nr:T9SS type A sorting domain-containing protein [Flavobacteriales bacterium]
MKQRVPHIAPFITAVMALMLAVCPSMAQQIEAGSRCGGIVSFPHPGFVDADMDGLSDTLEEVLLGAFVPKFVEFSDDDCPGPAVGNSAPGDSNIVVCHIFPLVGQYVEDDAPPTLYAPPVAVVEEGCLRSGLRWFGSTVIIYGALLYGHDCGLTGHVADVEGFAVSVRYIGPDDGVSWRSDTVLANWQGHLIQTVSHAGTLCQSVQTFPLRSAAFPAGKDTIYPSPDKHGNYLTRSACSGGIMFFCDPSCNNPYSLKKIKVVNVGEEQHPLVTDLGPFYAGYAGENPWGNSDFLASQSGSAGTIKDKMMREWRSDFIQPEVIGPCGEICAIYHGCNDCGDEVLADCIGSCQGVQDSQTGCGVPLYDCVVTDANHSHAPRPVLAMYPNPTAGLFTIDLGPTATDAVIGLYDMQGRLLATRHPNGQRKVQLEVTGPAGIYLVRVQDRNSIAHGRLLKL